MKHYKLGAHTKTGLKAHLVWVPKYRKRVLTGQVAIRVRDVIRQIAMEHEINILIGKVSCDHVHILIAYRANQELSKFVQYLKGISSKILILLQEFAHLRKKFWGNHFWARGYFTVSSGIITDEMIHEYIEEQEGEPMLDDGRFQIDSSSNPLS